LFEDFVLDTEQRELRRGPTVVPIAPLAFEHERPVKSVAFSSDGTRVLTGSDDKTACLWDSGTGKEIHAFK